MKRIIMKREPTAAELRDHIGVITTELQQILPARTLTEFNVADVNAHRTRYRDRIEARNLEIASTIANEKYGARMFSNFHEWEAFRNITTKSAARALAPDLVTSMHPFGNCLTMAAECYDDLRTKLEAEGPDYTEYVGRVQLVTNNWKQRANSARDYHCITIVRLPTHCIVIDAVACGTASRVPLGELYKPLGCSSQCFVYVAIGDARLLVEYEPNEPCYTLARPQSKGRFEYDDPYADVKGGLAHGIQDLAFPSVNWHMQGALPSRRNILIHQTWTRRPRTSVSVERLQVEKGWVVETGQMRVNFEKRKITVKLIPYTDLLNRQETMALMQRLYAARVLILPLRPTFAKFKISLADQGNDGFDEQTLRRLELMNEMCEALSMPEDGVLRIADVMQEVWAEHDEKNARSKKGT